MRKRRATKIDILADPIYNSKVVAKLINIVMIDGKKGTAQTIVYDAFEQIKNKTSKDGWYSICKECRNAASKKK